MPSRAGGLAWPGLGAASLLLLRHLQVGPAAAAHTAAPPPRWSPPPPSHRCSSWWAPDPAGWAGPRGQAGEGRRRPAGAAAGPGPAPGSAASILRSEGPAAAAAPGGAPGPVPRPLPQIDEPGQGSSQQAGAGQGGGRAGRGPLGSEIVWILARLPPAGKGPPPAPTPAPPPTGPPPVGSEITNRLDSVLAVVTRLHLQKGHRNLKIEGRLWYQNPKSLAGPRDP